ncbi:MAG: metal-sensitive transcriptional regulator [Candidatus Lambdaproteobacteria bacterium]|nr:metal-sensitive transcriptional regulator [Candidatus Lambdaproteobacteria bacterium]
MKALRQQFPDHQNQLARLAKIEGQLNGIRKMIEDRRYCVEIVQQIKAATAGLRQVQMGVLEKHIHHCVHEALETRNPDTLAAKVDEIVNVIARMD